MQESLALEHGQELLTDPPEDLLDGRVVANKCPRHLQALGRNIADGSEDVAGNPRHKVGTVLCLNIHDLIVHHFHGHLSTIDGGGSEVPAMARITGGHHVPRIKHLLSQLRHSKSTEVLRAAAGERSEAGHEEVETREGNHVDSQLAYVCIQLPGKSEGSGHSTHGGADEMIQITRGRIVKLQCAEANVKQCLVINAVSGISVFYELVAGENGIVRLHHSVRHFGRREDAERVDDSIRKLFADLGDEESAHARPSAPADGMGKLKALQAVASFCLSAHNVQHLLHKLSSFRVVTFSPVVASSRLSCCNRELIGHNNKMLSNKETDV